MDTTADSPVQPSGRGVHATRWAERGSEGGAWKHLGRHRATGPLEAGGDPFHDQAAVLVGRLLPCEVPGIQRVDLALG
jgi:hypothetical protein